MAQKVDFFLAWNVAEAGLVSEKMRKWLRK